MPGSHNRQSAQERPRTGRMILWSVAACLSLCSCATSSSLPMLAAVEPGPYRLASGDELRITVYGMPALTNSYTVDDGGLIALPLLDPINVAGMSVRQAETAIADGLRAHNIVLDPKVSAQILTYRPFYISGQVQKPGEYPC